jgi:hypothetical protein
MNIWNKNLKYQDFKKQIDLGLKELEEKHKNKSFAHNMLLKALKKLLYFVLYLYKLYPDKTEH